MTRILLTHGSRFLTGHILNFLLARGHSVVTVVNSKNDKKWIRRAYPTKVQRVLSIVYVKNMGNPNAFDKVVVSRVPFEAVIHAASIVRAYPKDDHITKEKKARGEYPPALGSINLLEAIKKNAPAVKRVVITSSISAVVPLSGSVVGKKYSEADWNPAPMPAPMPVTLRLDHNEIHQRFSGYLTSAEREAWDFVEKEKPNFALTSCIGAHLFGPDAYSSSVPGVRLEGKTLSSCSKLVDQFIQGRATQSCPRPTILSFFVDVRDFALGHVLAAEKKEAAGKRFVMVADKFCNKQIAEVLSENFPDLSDRLPKGENLKSGDFPAGGIPDLDNRRSVEVLGMKYRSFTESVVDTAKDLQPSDEVDGVGG